MERRKIIKAAGLLAATALTGCGGGEEAEDAMRDATSAQDDYGPVEWEEFDEPPVTASSESPDRLRPNHHIDDSFYPVVPKNTQYQVEVTIAGQGPVKVELYSGNFSAIGNKRVTLVDRPLSTGNVHALRFAMLRTNATFPWDTVQLQITFPIGNNIYSSFSNQTLKGLDSIVGDTAVRTFKADVYSSLTGFSKVIVRFYELPAEEFAPFYDDVFVRLFTNHAIHQTHDGLQSTIPLLHSNAKRMHGYEAKVIRAPETNEDTLCIPVDGDFHLMPCQAACQDSLKPLVKRHLGWHLQRLAAAHNNAHGVKTPAEDPAAYQMMENETMRVIGGTGFVNWFRGKVKGVSDSLAQVTTITSANIASFIDAQVASFNTEERRALARQLAEVNSNNTLLKDRTGFQFNSMIALQFGASAAKPIIVEGLDGLALGGGVRWSMPFYRFNLVHANGTWVSRVYQIGGEDYKFSCVGIVKAFNGSYVINPVNILARMISIDVEVTFNVTHRKGKTGARLDSVVLDPVFDFDLTKVKWLTWLVRKGIDAISGHKLNFADQALKINPSPLANSNALNAATDAAAAGMGPTVAGAGTGQALTGAAKALKTAADKLGKMWDVLEVSPLRFVWINPNTLPGKTFSNGWTTQPLWGYAPGVKWIAGPGFAATSTTIQFSGSLFARVVHVMDIGGAIGSATFVQAAQFRTNG